MSAPKVSVDLTALPELTNKKFYPLYADTSRYLVLWGGAGSGKSVFAAEKLILRTIDETPHKFLIVRKVSKTHRDSTFAELKNVIRQWGIEKLFTIKEGDMRIVCINGNEIIFCGLDDVEKMKSIHGVTGIWIEEASELDRSDFLQLNLRLRGQRKHYKQIIISFNPVSIVHWLKTVFFDSPLAGTRVVHSTYKDNRFIDDEYIATLLELEDVDEYYFTVYVLGQWGVLGKTVFNAKIVTERLLQVQREKPIRTGTFVYKYENEKIVDDSIEFIDDENGPLRIYELPIEGYPYVLGADTAEGGIDYSTASVRNNISWVQAATWRGHTDTDLFAKQLYCLGKWYNRALIGVETNFDLHVTKELARLGYTNQYVRETLDKYTGETQKKFGFQSTKITRPIIISKLVTMVREHIETFNDLATLEEMLTFVRDENGRPSAQSGKHDDTIFADAIALEIRQQGSFRIHEKMPEKSKIAKHKESRAKRALDHQRRRIGLS